MPSRRGAGALAVAFTLAASLVVILPAAHAGRSKCFGRRATIVGTKGRDRIRGTKRADVIVARGGADRIVGRGGNDRICAGGGRDEVVAGRGNDRVKSGKGADVVFGRGGKDQVRAGRGSDFVEGGRGRDRLFMEGGHEEFAAGSGGGDVIDLGPGIFQFALPGRGDDDVIGFEPEPGGFSFDFVGYFDARNGVNVDLEAGIATGEGTDTLVSIEGVDGSEFDDVLTGTAGSNFLFGAGGSDVMNDGGNSGSLDLGPDAVLGGGLFDAMGGDFGGVTGDDTFNGEGPGVHVIFYDQVAGGVTVDLAAGNATGEGNDTLNGINAIAAGLGDDTLLGDGNANAFDPGAGTDSVDGREGEDTLILFEALGAVADLAAGAASGEYVTFTEQGEEALPFSWTLAGIENLWGSDRDADTLRGDAGPNEIFGLAGADQLFGLAGDDLLNGGRGSDTGDGGEGADECLSLETESNCEEGEPTVAGRVLGRTPFSGFRMPTAIRRAFHF